MPRTGFLLPIVALSTSLAVARLEATDCERLEAGDTVYAASPGAGFIGPDQAPMPLPEGAEIRISAVSGDRVEGMAVIGGEMRQGWIPAAKVHKPDDAASVAALRRIDDLRLHADRFGAIQRVVATDTPFGGEDLEFLQGLYTLEGLELSGSRVTNDDLCHLAGLTNLRRLYLDRTSVNDEGLRALRHLANLEVLVLSRSSVRGPGLVHLRHLRSLRVLNLSDCQLDDDALRHLAGCNQVQTLALENAPIRGTGLVHLKSMERLNVLNLSGCALRPGALLHLREAANLRIIRARETPIPAEDREVLESANPRLAIFP